MNRDAADTGQPGRCSEQGTAPTLEMAEEACITGTRRMFYARLPELKGIAGGVASAAAAPASAQSALCEAKALQLAGRYADARAILRAAVACLPDHAATKRLLANLLREQGHFDKAIPRLEAATEGRAVEAAAAYCDLVNSRRVTAEDEPMLAQMQAMLGYRPLSAGARQWLHFALGKAHGDLADYPAAMRHYDAGNALGAARRPFDRARFGSSVQRVIAACPGDFLAEHRLADCHSELPVLVLGMPHSGTTLVGQILCCHPAVAAGDELTFWNETAEGIARFGDQGLTETHLRDIAGDYETALRRVDPEALRVTDKTPGNFL